jgi:hypothetical protein
MEEEQEEMNAEMLSLASRIHVNHEEMNTMLQARIETGRESRLRLTCRDGGFGGNQSGANESHGFGGKPRRNLGRNGSGRRSVLKR